MQRFLLQLSFILMFFLLQGALVEAQTFSFSLNLTPSFPGPNEEVVARISPENSFVTNTVVWRVNGEVISSGVGETQFSFMSGGVGETTEVSATVVRPNESVTRSVDIDPADVDLVWEANTYTPPFYQGRALGTSNASVRVVAIPHVPGSSSDELIYTWSFNNRVHASRSGEGRDTFHLILSPRTSVVSVEVARANGDTLAQGSARIRAYDPDLRIYRNHPLKGVLFNDSVRGTVAYNENEVGFTAFPYFISVDSPNTSAVEYGWRVDGTVVDDDRALTVRAGEGGARSRIGFSVENSLNAFEDLVDNFVVELTGPSL